MKGAITNYENTLFMDGVALSGVISFDGSYNIETVPINVIGKGFCKQVVSQVPSASVSITRYLVNNDPVFGLTGDADNYTASFINGGLIYQGKNFGFTIGYLSSFGISCSVGEVPQIQSSFQIFGNMGPSIDPSGNNMSSAVFVPQVKNISVTCNNSSTNRVKDFRLVAIDCVADPSFSKAFVNGILESKQYVLTKDGSFEEIYDNFEDNISNLPRKNKDNYLRKLVIDFINKL